MELLELAKEHDFAIDSIQVLDYGTVIRGVGIKKLQTIREVLLPKIKRPISCHREEGSSEAFMIIWNS